MYENQKWYKMVMKLREKIKMRRKLFIYTFMLMAGICTAYFFDQIPELLVLSVPVFLLLQKLNGRKLSGKLCIFFAAGMILLLIADYHFEQGSLADYASEGKEADFTGKIEEIQEKDEDAIQLVVNVQGQRILCRYYGALSDPWSLQGCWISFKTKIELPAENGNPRCFNYRLYLKSRKIGFITTLSSFDVEEEKGRHVLDKIEGDILKKREDFLQDTCVSEHATAFIRGIVFGDISQLSEDEYAAFRQNGTAHVLAVSGLHIGILYRVYRWIEERLHTKLCGLFLFCEL